MGRIFLIRHGQTDSNSGQMFQGQMDTSLNALGHSQSRQMAEYMKRFKIDAIYCSSMLRARQTCAPLAMAQGLAYHPLDLLKEVSFGDWEGVPFTEIHKIDPEGMTTFLERPGDFTPPKGETFAEAQQRWLKALDYIVEREGHDKNIAIVSHGGIIRLQICSFLGIPLNNLWKMAIRNVSVSTISDWQGNYMVENVNDDHFLNNIVSKGYISIV